METEGIKDEGFVVRMDKDRLGELIDFTSLVDEVSIRMKEDGLHILQMNPSQIAEMRVDIPKEQLLEYTINSPEIKVGFDRDSVKQILKVIDNGDITLMRDATNTERMLVVAGDSEFSVPMLEIKETAKEPAFDTDYEITIPAKDLLNKIKEVELFSSNVAFETNGVDFNWSYEDKYKTKFKGFSLVCLKEVPAGTAPPTAKAVYPLQYLKTILTGVKKYLVKLYFKTNSPIKIVVVKDGINVLYYLAPRIED